MKKKISILKVHFSHLLTGSHKKFSGTVENDMTMQVVKKFDTMLHCCRARIDQSHSPVGANGTQLKHGSVS